MSSPAPALDITGILLKLNAGDDAARGELFTAVYSELRRLARLSMLRERREHTLQPTALVHEAFLRLTAGAEIGWENRGHFFTVAAKTMRRILVDHARALQAKKRSGGLRVELDSRTIVGEAKTGDIVALDEVLNELEAVDPRQCRVVELIYFAGLSNEEAACALGVSARTVRRDWVLARAWLHSRLAR